MIAQLFANRPEPYEYEGVTLYLLPLKFSDVPADGDGSITRSMETIHRICVDQTGAPVFASPDEVYQELPAYVAVAIMQEANRRSFGPAAVIDPLAG